MAAKNAGLKNRREIPKNATHHFPERSGNTAGRSAAAVQPIKLNTINDKSKLAERQGRKAMGLL